MSRLTYCEYRGLEGKTVVSVRWSNQADFKALTIKFADNTIFTLRLNLTVDEEGEVAVFVGGNVENPRTLVPIPIRAQVNPLEP
ncbi:MAG TPA: hypothetical protein VMI10_24945 [Terriglobales bacterium]|nr:hypothetical protein [Terriglobales bacterium]